MEKEKEKEKKETRKKVMVMEGDGNRVIVIMKKKRLKKWTYETRKDDVEPAGHIPILGIIVKEVWQFCMYAKAG